MTMGIYKIENLVNHKIYIGQSVHIEHRIQEHVSEAFHKNKTRLAYNSIIHKAMRKYGWDNFEWAILEECDYEYLDEKEKYWIKQLNSLAPYGYNIMIGGQQNRKNYNNSEKICPKCGKEKDKQAKLCRECYYKEINKERIQQLADEGQYSFILRILNTSYLNVANSLGYVNSNGLKKLLQKKGWVYCKKDMFDYYYLTNKKYHPKDKRSKKKDRLVYQRDKDSYKIIDSFLLNQEECQKRNFHTGHVYECCIGKRKKYKEYIFTFATASRPVMCLDSNSLEQIQSFSSLYQAAQWCMKKELTNNKSAGSVKKGIKKSCDYNNIVYGYRWKYV